MPKRPTTKKANSTSKIARKTEKNRVQQMPGYVRFSKDALRTLFEHKRLFVKLWALMTSALLVVVGINEVEQYSLLSGAADDAVAGLNGATDRYLVMVGILLSSLLGGTVSSSLTELQQTLRTGTYILIWLVTVWLLRHLLADSAVRLRDGLYSAMAPLLSALLVIGIAVIQLLPIALVTSLFTALLDTGALNAALVTFAMIVSILLLGAVTLYWLTATVMALMIVTIPGTYPLAAYRSAKVLVSGKRRMVLLRIVWLGIVSLATYIALMLPVLLLDAAAAFPLTFIVVLLSNLAATGLVIYTTTYLYLLYRRIVDEQSK